MILMQCILKLLLDIDIPRVHLHLLDYSVVCGYYVCNVTLCVYNVYVPCECECIIMYTDVYNVSVRVCVCVCVRACVRTCVCM